jgi:hypothetical protein
MTAIICNTLTGAVSEYSNFDFHAITPTHAGAATGLFAFGGNTDLDSPIVASVTTGKKLRSGSLKKSLELVYLSLKGTGTSTMSVIGESNTYAYPFAVLPAGQSRAVPGKGIRENYLAFRYSNTDGAPFQLDRIEVLVNESKNRRI